MLTKMQFGKLDHVIKDRLYNITKVVHLHHSGFDDIPFLFFIKEMTQGVLTC